MRLIALLPLLVAAPLLRAADFQAVTPSGQTLYYKIVQGGVEVTFPNNTIQPVTGWDGYNKPTGTLAIPDSVSYGGVTYAVKAIGNHAFYECTGLASVVVPEGVASVRASAFRGCSGLTAISLPASLDSLYGYSLAYCTALAEVTVAGTVPPVCLANVFSNTAITAATLNVPCGHAAAWNAVAPWNQFSDIDDDACNVTLMVTANYSSRGSVSGSGTFPYGTNVLLTASPAAGFFFACWSDGDTLNPRVLTLHEDCSLAAMFFALRYDSLVVQVHDTVPVHDTVMVVVVHVDTVLVHDTTVVTLTEVDTVYRTDTVMPTIFRLTVATDGGGVGIGNGLLPAGTVAEIGALPMEGNRFLRWDDGNADNPRTVTVAGNMTYTALFEALGIQVVDHGMTWSAVAEVSDIVVTGVQGRQLRVFSVDGRQLYSGCAQRDTVRFRCTTAGVYLVSVDGSAACKVIVD
ncbi:MAG: leucine-rich repeat domain-containing protein [Bacteroidales bacterium]|nr:leucine-rich repeat domain-containing protein [Bacteroidales bacterium]